MCVIEREQGFSQRLRLRRFRCDDGMYFLIHVNSLTSDPSRRRDRGLRLRVPKKAKKYAGASRLREHARVLRIPVAALSAATNPRRQTASVTAEDLRQC